MPKRMALASGIIVISSLSDKFLSDDDKLSKD
jgi:hypothetical protein